MPLSAVFQAITITTGDLLWISALMWAPAAASVVARLVLREGFADVSFRFGGRRTWKYLVLAPVIPTVIGLIAYGIAWATGLAQFDPQPAGLVTPLVGDTASPATIFVVTLALAATIGTVMRAGIQSMDSRAHKLLARWNESGVADEILEFNGQRPFAALPPVLLAWFKETQPEVLEQTRRAVYVKEWIR